jgi:hypothetical protein
MDSFREIEIFYKGLASNRHVLDSGIILRRRAGTTCQVVSVHADSKDDLDRSANHQVQCEYRSQAELVRHGMARTSFGAGRTRMPARFPDVVDGGRRSWLPRLGP